MKKMFFTTFQMISFFLLAGSFSLSAGYIGYIYPAGAKVGEKTTIIVAGQSLWGLHSAIITGDGVTVEKVEGISGFNHPYGPQRRYIQECFRAKKNNRPLPSMPLDFSEWRPHPYYDHFETLSTEKLDLAIEDFFAVRNSLQSSPSISNRVLVTLSIAPDAKPGRREFRLCGRWKSTNFLPFYITTNNEVREKIFELPPAKAGISSFTVPATLHGQILPGGEKDSFFFSAKKGENFFFRVRARELVPFMGDCVPGHFQPILEIQDRKSGKSLAVADYNYSSPDPMLTFTAPQAGEYTLNIRDALHRGRKDFVYLVEALPGTGKEKKISRGKAPDFAIAKVRKEDISGKIIKDPVMIEGVLAGNREKHTFQIQGKKGESRIMKVYARSLNSPLDSLLTLRDEDGKLLARNDDMKEEVLLGTRHHKADSEILYTFPEDGIYSLSISDTAANGSPDHFYCLRVDVPRPDFDVVLAPSNLYIAPWGGQSPLTFTVIAREGFSAPVNLEFSTGDFFFTGTNIIPSGLREGTLTAGARIDKKYTAKAPVNFQIRAKSGKIVKNVIPADKAMQAFAYTHFVPASNFVGVKLNRISGSSRFAFRGDFIPTPSEKKGKGKKRNRRQVNTPPSYKVLRNLSMPAGGEKIITITASSLPKDSTYSFQLKNPPKGISLGKLTLKTTEKWGFEVNTLPVKAAKDAGKGVYLLQLEAVYEYDTSPDANGEIHRRKNVSPLPTLLLEVK